MKSKIVIWGLLLMFIVSAFAGFTTHGAQENHPSKRDLNSGLVAYWDFDEGSGNILHDKSGNGNDGTIYNATWVKGVSGDALNFDGVDSYVEVKSNKNLAPITYTVNIWFKPHNPTYLSGWEEIITKGINKLYYQIQWGGEYANDDNEVEFWYEDQYDSDYFIYSNPIKVGMWHMATMVYSEGKLTAYVDGTYVAENQFDVSPYDSGEDLYIGHGDSGYFNGTIDEARIYNRALSSEEIKDLYYRYVPKAPGNLQAGAGNGYVNLTWSPPADDGGSAINEYKIYRDGRVIATVGNGHLYYNDTNVVNGETYTYYVTAVNFVRESDKSNVVQATPMAEGGSSGGRTETNTNLVGIWGNPWLWIIIILIIGGIVAGILIAINRERNSEVPPPEEVQEEKEEEMITVSCPECGFTSQVPANMRGRWVKCPKCGNQFQIP